MRKLFVTLLLAVTACLAQAEPAATRAENCVLAMAEPLTEVYKRYDSGMDPSLIEYMARRETKLGGAGRGMLVVALGKLQWYEATNGKKQSLGQFLTESLELCKLKTPTLPLPKRQQGAITDGDV